MPHTTEPAPALWLWVDTETTALLDDRPAVLEAAWMVTDSDLRQLTPLRQRLCAIPWPVSFPWFPIPDSRRLGSWADLRMSEKVRELHADSGLMWDWTGAASRIEAIRDLDDVLQADLAEAVLDLRFESPVKIHLAGAGVAQFEARLLPALGSKVMTWCHYRCADTSITSMVTGVPKVDGPDPDDGLELDVQAGVDVVRATSEVHRAAADVRIAWATARAVRGLVRPTA